MNTDDINNNRNEENGGCNSNNSNNSSNSINNGNNTCTEVPILFYQKNRFPLECIGPGSLCVLPESESPSSLKDIIKVLEISNNIV